MTWKDTSGRNNYLLVYTFDKKFRVALFMNKNNARRIICNATPERVTMHRGNTRTTRTSKSASHVVANDSHGEERPVC